ncbi:hypothetical protein FJZ33_10320, partial [Candidatus Poribacteria bacterium]|nr:hypothetical protein [Candidatus Poribacteria bacterium]
MKLISVIILLFLVTISALARQEISLSGQWEFKFSSNGKTPPNGEWSKINIPNHVTQREEQYVWYRRYFDVPGTMSGERVFLKFLGVKFVCEVYINGSLVGGHYGGWEPFELEITDKCKIDGQNQILVKAQDFRGVVDQYLNNGSGRLFERANDSVMAPVGSLPEEYGIWQDVFLESRKDVYIDDVFVRTSVRSKFVEVDYNLINMSEIKRSIRLESRVFDGEKPGLDLGYTQLEILPRSSKKITIKKEWTAPELWWPYSPKLYFLKSRLIENSKPVDELSNRFGFREFWNEGIYFFLNGVKIKLLATAGHPVYGWAKEDAKKLYSDIRLANCNAMRLHANIWPETWYEAADEVGMLIIQESALWCFAKEYALSKPKFWDNMKDHLRGMIRRDKNHPSVIMYSIENEILHVGGT